MCHNYLLMDGAKPELAMAFVTFIKNLIEKNRELDGWVGKAGVKNLEPRSMIL